MKYIFLDIDGVMVPAKSWSPPPLLDDGFPDFSSKSVDVLNQLIGPDLTIILTTSHKSNYSITEWHSIFEKRGLKISTIERLNENVENKNRREEMLAWFVENEMPDNFVIIDDDKSLNELPMKIKQHLVQTSSTIGLKESHSEAICLLLNKID